MVPSRFFALTLLLMALPLSARAQSPAPDCSQLKILDIVHMVPSLIGDADFIPVVIGGKPRAFLFDTGGYYSQISRPLATDLGLTAHQTRRDLYDLTGNVSRQEVTVPQLTLGEITDSDVALMISPALGTGPTQGVGGVIAPDLFGGDDAELDFSTDTLNLFSPDHCAGHVVYWKAPAVAQVPISMQRALSAMPQFARNSLDGPGNHIMVTVMLDGQKLKALLDTGAATTSLRQDEAEQLYHLTMGGADTPFKGPLNGDATLKTYSHLFHTLSFGAVTVSNARITIIPDAMSRNVEPILLAGGFGRTERDLVRGPELILGMDVLRRLRIYLAFHEGKMYVSPATAAPPGTVVQPYTKDFIVSMLALLDNQVAAAPADASLLNDRCFWRAIANTDLDAAMADCDQSLKLNPGDSDALDSRAFVFYQKGDYQSAITAYDAALKADNRLAPSLLMRGFAKGKLGDSAGHDADIAAAKAIDPNVEAEFKRIGISA